MKWVPHKNLFPLDYENPYCNCQLFSKVSKLFKGNYYHECLLPNLPPPPPLNQPTQKSNLPGPSEVAHIFKYEAIHVSALGIKILILEEIFNCNKYTTLLHIHIFIDLKSITTCADSLYWPGRELWNYLTSLRHIQDVQILMCM